MLNPRIDIPLDALGEVIDSATATAGQLTDSVGDLSDAVASQVVKVLDDTRERRLSVRHVIVAVVALGVVAGVVVLIRRSRDGGRQAETLDAGAASPN
jgi:hypothetical protein